MIFDQNKNDNVSMTDADLLAKDELLAIISKFNKVLKRLTIVLARCIVMPIK